MAITKQFCYELNVKGATSSRIAVKSNSKVKTTKLLIKRPINFSEMSLQIRQRKNKQANENFLWPFLLVYAW